MTENELGTDVAEMRKDGSLPSRLRVSLDVRDRKRVKLKKDYQVLSLSNWEDDKKFLKGPYLGDNVLNIGYVEDAVVPVYIDVVNQAFKNMNLKLILACMGNHQTEIIK